MASESAASETNKDAAFVKYWLSQLDSYYDEFKDWEARAEKIVQRYRDDRGVKSDGSYAGGARFNALWSNVQTLQPAIYIKPPKPVIERRYLDKDPIARLSSMTLERSIEVTLQECGFHPSTQKAVQDYLLAGRGTVWDRYEPTYGTPEDLGPQAQDDEGTDAPAVSRSVPDDNEDEGEPEEAARPVTWEKVYTDYVNWKNFRHSPSPVWEEVWWVAKREFLIRRELRTRFKGRNPVSKRLIADEVPLSTDNNDRKERQQADGRAKKLKRQPSAEVWEIWDKRNKEVVFIATQYADCPLERSPDPLELQEFWPCPKPLYATTTTDTLVPVPDYIEYQDQADELDNLTARIRALTDALRVNGVYDASIPALKRILQEGADNRMIGVANWAELAQKGGLEGAMDFVPLKDISDTLIKLYDARDRTKADMAEITGISDIVRGQAQGAAKTATEQRIKGQFATLRLEDRKAEVARFCRDNVAINAEIIAEQFSPEILAQMTGMLAFIAEEIKNDPQTMGPLVASMMQAQPGIGPNGGSPMQPAPGVPPPGNGAPGGGLPNTPPAAGMQPQGLPPEMIEQAAQAIFQQCVKLLKDDKMRTFRIDIETNSTIEVDRQAEKESVVELFTAVGGFLEKSLPIGQMMPEMVPALGQSLLFAFRRFGVGRDVEGVWEAAIDKLAQKAKNPPPKQPSPEEIKAQAELQKQQMENQRAQEEAQRDQQQAALDMQAKQQEHQMKMEEMQADLEVKRQELALKRIELSLNERHMQTEGAMKERQMTTDMQLSEQKAQLDAKGMQQKHDLSLQAMEAKAQQAKQNRPARAQ